MLPDDLIGVGLRSPHYPYLLDRPRTSVGWFEAISENYIDTAGRPLSVLETIRQDYPVALHGVSMSISGHPAASGRAHQADALALRERYLGRLSKLVERIDPFVVSDHLCWTGTPAGNVHDLLPVPFTEASLQWVTSRVGEVQDRLGRPFVVENVSSYLTYRSSEMQEWEFLCELVRRSGCLLLLDVNNVYVSARNHGFDPCVYLDAIPAEAVAQIHLAGHTDLGTHLFDTHSTFVCEEVWRLFDRVIRRMPEVPVLVEWDEDIPEFSVLEAEAGKARQIRSRHHSGGAEPAGAVIGA